MATTFILVRHAAHDLVDSTLVGRMDGVHLGPAGLRQAAALAGRLTPARIAAVQSSPRERAQETAAPIAHALGLAVETARALDEIDVGEWTGRPFAALRDDPRWQAWNQARTGGQAPGGEAAQAVQDRVVAHLQALHRAHPDGQVVLVSHSGVIKSALLHYLDSSLDNYWRFDIAPASWSTLVLERGQGCVTGLNHQVAE